MGKAKCFCCGKEFHAFGKHDLYCEDCRERESKKDMEIFENATDNDLTRLACGVMAVAREDFDKAVRHWHRADTELEKRHAFIKVRTEMDWWRSKFFKIWGGTLDGNKILRGLIKYTELPKITKFRGFKYEKDKEKERLMNGN